MKFDNHITQFCMVTYLVILQYPCQAIQDLTHFIRSLPSYHNQNFFYKINFVKIDVFNMQNAWK